MTVRPTRQILRAAMALVVLVATALLPASPAMAACHIAGFSPAELQTSEQGGTVEVTVVLQGRQPSCAGTVDYATADQEAVAGEDYEAASGTLTFVADDDREEIITIPILADDTAEGAEAFRLELSNPTEGISGTGVPAVITIEADEPAQSGLAEDAGTEDAAPDADATEAAASDDDAAADEDATSAEDGGGTTVLVLIGIAIVVIAVVGIGLRSRGRRDTT